ARPHPGIYSANHRTGRQAIAWISFRHQLFLRPREREGVQGFRGVAEISDQRKHRAAAERRLVLHQQTGCQSNLFAEERTADRRLCTHGCAVNLLNVYEKRSQVYDAQVFEALDQVTKFAFSGTEVCFSVAVISVISNRTLRQPEEEFGTLAIGKG